MQLIKYENKNNKILHNKATCAGHITQYQISNYKNIELNTLHKIGKYVRILPVKESFTWQICRAFSSLFTCEYLIKK